MSSDRLSHIEIDNLLSGCKRRVRRDPAVLVHVEHMILGLDYCIRNFDCSECSPLLIDNHKEILDALSEPSINAFNYETLQALPNLLDCFAEVIPGGLTSDIEMFRDLIEERLKFHEHILGTLPLDHVPLRFHGELEEYSENASTPHVNLLFVSRAPDNLRMFDIGKVLRASLSAKFVGEWSLTKRFEPLISFEKRINEYKDPFASQLRASIFYAEDLLIRRHGIKELRKIPREYTFEVSSTGDGPDWAQLFSGGSAGLGFALLSMAVIGRLKLHNSAGAVSGDCAFTGTLGDEGMVLSVEDSDIPTKTQAAFFSPCKKLVLPEDNYQTALKEYNRLKEIHPEREMEIIQADSVEEISKNTSVFKYTPVSKWSVIREKFKRKKKYSIIGLCLMVIVLLSVTLIPPIFDHEIAKYDLMDNQVNFYNRFRVKFKSYDLGYHVNLRKGEIEKYSALSHSFHHTDITGNGQKDLLVVSVEADSTEHRQTGKIHAHLFSSNGELVSHVPLWDSLRVDLPDGAQIFRDFTFNWDGLADFDKDGFKELVVGSPDILYYPGIICNVSLIDSTYQMFVNVGHMVRFVIGDFDCDGLEEIVAAGESNIFQAAVIAVLDPARMKGTTPTVRVLFDGEKPEDIAKVYIKVPPSRLKTILPGCNKPFIDQILINSDDLIQLSVYESAKSDAPHPIIYYLDSEWRCYHVDLTGRYRDYVAEHYNIDGDELLDTIQVYSNELKNSFTYWNGKKWVKEPTINPGYIKATEIKD